MTSSAPLAHRGSHERLLARLVRAGILLVTVGAVVLLAWLSAHPAQAAVRAAGGCAEATLVGHRGTDVDDDGNPIRNNTVAAFRAAVAAGADVVELDIHRTKPNSSGHATWIVNHDKTLDGYVIAKTPYATLKAAQPDLATYRQAVRAVSATKAGMEVEIKPSSVGNGSLRYFADVAKAYRMTSRLQIDSFHRGVLGQFVALDTGLQSALITKTYTDSDAWRAGVRALGSTVLLRSTAATTADVAALQAADLRVFVWTVDDPAGWSAVVGDGVNGVVTDQVADYVTWCSSAGGD